MKKTLYSLPALQDVMQACNRRYLEFPSEMVDPTAGVKKSRGSERVRIAERASLSGLPPLRYRRPLPVAGAAAERVCLEWHPQCQAAACVVRLFRWAGFAAAKRLHLYGLIKKVGKTYTYHLTRLDGEAATEALKLRELVVIPTVAGFLPAGPNLRAP